MLALAVSTLGFSASSPIDALKAALQADLDELAAKNPSFALGLGWTSAEGSFGLAAGNVTLPIGAHDAPVSRAAVPTDKFLFGSGTKPITATAILRLVEAGAVSLDDPLSRHVDSVLQRANGTTLTGLFGKEAAKVTVGHLVRMESGLADFDIPSLDGAILLDGQGEWPPYAILRVAAAQKPPVHFTPGSKVEYSSTNFVLAGLVLLAHSPQAGGDWKKLDLFNLAFPPAARADYAAVSFVNDEPVDTGATVPGISSFIKGKTTQIWRQKGGILGWTCGNMAASAHDVSRFYYDLLVRKTLLTPQSVALMEQFNLLSYGWAKGYIAYGLGLMLEQHVSTSPLSHHGKPPDFSQWGAYIGHGGDTYGFLSEQGIIGQLNNASFSVVANQDGNTGFVTLGMACRLIQTAAKVLQGQTINLHCSF